jgi:hypothetical protein
MSKFTMSKFTMSKFTMSKFTMTKFTMSKFTMSKFTMSKFTMSNHQCLGIQRDNIFDKYISRKNERSYDTLCFSPFLRSYTGCLGVSSSQR